MCTNAENMQHPPSLTHTDARARARTHTGAPPQPRSCIDGKQSKVAHGQPAGNYSTSHHIPQHTWRPHAPSHESGVRADGIAANIFFFHSFLFFLPPPLPLPTPLPPPPHFSLALAPLMRPSSVASVCKSGRAGEIRRTLPRRCRRFAGSRRWTWARPEPSPLRTRRRTGAIVRFFTASSSASSARCKVSAERRTAMWRE